MNVPHLTYVLFICAACAVEMLVQDTIWTVATKAIASNNRFVAAVFNSLGDGMSKAMSIITIVLIAATVSRSVVFAQVVGNMLGAFLGVYTGNIVSSALDKTFAWYHKHPMHLIIARRANHGS